MLYWPAVAPWVGYQPLHLHDFSTTLTRGLQRIKFAWCFTSYNFCSVFGQRTISHRLIPSWAWLNAWNICAIIAEIVIIVHVICQGSPQYIHHLLIFAQANDVFYVFTYTFTADQYIISYLQNSLSLWSLWGFYVCFKIVDFHLFLFFNKEKYLLFFLILFE